MATLDLTGGAPTDDDVVAAAVSSSGRAEVIISAPASLEESIVAVLDPDQGWTSPTNRKDSDMRLHHQ